jgi:hypothetical protein
MSTKKALQAAVETALTQGTKRLREYEHKAGKMLPPPPLAGLDTFREYYFALFDSARDPELYAGILQHFLRESLMPIPSGVFKRLLYEPLMSTALSPDGVPKPMFSAKIGRPSKYHESLALALQWIQKGQPTFGEFFNQLNPGKKFTAQQRKRGADRIRQQINSALPHREKNKK